VIKGYQGSTARQITGINKVTKGNPCPKSLKMLMRRMILKNHSTKFEKVKDCWCGFVSTNRRTGSLWTDSI